VKFIDGELLCDVVMEADTPPERYDFAFYLYADGTRVATRWYESSTRATFACPPGAGDLRALAFARPRGRDEFFTAEKTVALKT